MASSITDIPSYDGDVDFETLAIEDPAFAAVYRKADGKLDFQDPRSVQYANIVKT